MGGGGQAAEAFLYLLTMKGLPPPLPNPMDQGRQIPGPTDMSDPAVVAQWHSDMATWREEYRFRTHYDGAIYDDPALKWTQTSYMQPQMHPYDRYFYDPTSHNYTVQRWLDDVKRRYGGVDSLLMWPTYTNIGCVVRHHVRTISHGFLSPISPLTRRGGTLYLVLMLTSMWCFFSSFLLLAIRCDGRFTGFRADDRSQFDLFEAMPGGLAGVRSVIDELHAAGIKVLIPYNPWDIGTRRCGDGGTCGGSVNAAATGVCNGAACDAMIITSLLKQLDGDGFNGDTMANVAEDFYSDSIKINHSIAIEPELGGGGVLNGLSTGN